MKVLITGDQGFIGKNLKLFLKSRSDITIFTFSKKNKTSDLNDCIDMRVSPSLCLSSETTNICTIKSLN